MSRRRRQADATYLVDLELIEPINDHAEGGMTALLTLRVLAAAGHPTGMPNGIVGIDIATGRVTFVPWSNVSIARFPS